MSESPTTIEPISASADGKRNAFSLTCVTTGQGMNYAACLWRQGVLATPNVKTPADWAVCGIACKQNTCVALTMRREEELAGKAIYFEDRNIIRRITAAAVRWILPDWVDHHDTPKVKKPTLSAAEKRESAPRSSKGTSMLDAIGSAGDLSHAVTAAARSEATKPPVSAAAPRPAITAQAGESPLQMARRIAAMRSL